jgi:hypothetical protein
MILHGLQQRVEFRHSSEAGVHVGQLAGGAVCHGFALQIGGGVLGELPSLSPRLQCFRIMPRVVVFEAEIGQKRRVPGGLWAGFEKPDETGEIIWAGTLRVAQECGGQGAVFGRRWICSDRHQGLFKNPSPENILRRGTWRQIRRTLRWLDL